MGLTGTCSPRIANSIHFTAQEFPQGSGGAEIDFIEPGHGIAIYEVKGFQVGCAICWDLRFPELFAAYRQRECGLSICPALFFADVPTDIQFWESLLCGRAIDTACYLASATICGSTSPPSASGTPDGAPVRFNWVTRLVDPLGTILARGEDDVPGFVQGTVTSARLDVAQENFPVDVK